MPTDDYAISDLARLTGLSVRTIRYYLAQGLIPASGESGPGAHYGQGHLDRLRLIKRLQAEYLPNAEIRRRLAPLSDAEVAALVGEPPDVDPARPTTSALDYVRGVLGVAPAPSAPVAFPPTLASIAPPAAPVAPVARARLVAEEAAPFAADQQEAPMPDRSQWERLALGPDIELHIRRPLSRPQQRRVERLITIARQVLSEDQ